MGSRSADMARPSKNRQMTESQLEDDLQVVVVDLGTEAPFMRGSIYEPVVSVHVPVPSIRWSIRWSIQVVSVRSIGTSSTGTSK